MSKLRIVLADDHALVRAGLRMVINAEADMEVVAEAATTHDAIDAVVRTSPDLLTLDLSMPGSSSIKAIETVRKKSPNTKVLVLTTHDDPAYLKATLAAGCDGYLVKTVGDSELLSALRALAEGRTVINLPLSKENVHSMMGMKSQAKPEHPGLAALSEREREVLALLARGHTNQAIADRIGLSVKTIETYRSRIGEKLGLRSRAELVAFAVEMGLMGTLEFE